MFRGKSQGGIAGRIVSRRISTGNAAHYGGKLAREGPDRITNENITLTIRRHKTVRGSCPEAVYPQPEAQNDPKKRIDITG